MKFTLKLITTFIMGAVYVIVLVLSTSCAEVPQYGTKKTKEQTCKYKVAAAKKATRVAMRR